VSDRTYRAVQVAEPGAPLTGVDVPLREPGPGHVRVKVEACGVCHTDASFVDGTQPGLTFPITPGHEIAGVIDALGQDVHPWKVGDRVAIGWSGSIRNAGPGDVVAILGLGGLGHLGVQFAAKMGFRTVAIAPGAGDGRTRPHTRRPPLHRRHRRLGGR
jgi:D-arabinose 1-dehydrogenase-like Zn-dependent alcohol dehydrogenase